MILGAIPHLRASCPAIALTWNKLVGNLSLVLSTNHHFKMFVNHPRVDCRYGGYLPWGEHSVMVIHKVMSMVVCNLGLIAAQDATKAYVMCQQASDTFDCTYHASKSAPPPGATAWGLVNSDICLSQ